MEFAVALPIMRTGWVYAAVSTVLVAVPVLGTSMARDQDGMSAAAYFVKRCSLLIVVDASTVFVTLNIPKNEGEAEPLVSFVPSLIKICPFPRCHRTSLSNVRGNRRFVLTSESHRQPVDRETSPSTASLSLKMATATATAPWRSMRTLDSPPTGHLAAAPKKKICSSNYK